MSFKDKLTEKGIVFLLKHSEMTKQEAEKYSSRIFGFLSFIFGFGATISIIFYLIKKVPVSIAESSGMQVLIGYVIVQTIIQIRILQKIK